MITVHLWAPAVRDEILAKPFFTKMAARSQRAAKTTALALLSDQTPSESDDSDIDDTSSCTSNEDNDTEDSDIIAAHESSDEAEESLEDTNMLQDKNGHNWSKNAPALGRRRAADILRRQPGPKAIARKETILKTWTLFFRILFWRR